jgi:predicted Zn-dependent peptidase
MKRLRVGIAAALVGLALSSGTSGAAALDRNQRPVPGPTPAVATPKVTRVALKNGLPVWVVTRHELPIVDVLLQIRAGSAQDEARPGISAMTASLLDDGTAKHSSLEFAEAVSFLGASLNASAGVEQTSISLLTLGKHLDAALGLMGEMVVQPAFKDEELERERKSRLQGLKQQRDVATATADRVFNLVVNGEDHPYGHPAGGTLEGVQAVTHDEILSFYDRYYRPGNSTLVVVGDVTPEEILPKLEQALGTWVDKPVPAAAREVPARPAAKPTAVYLVDKPNAAQSEIRIGLPGAPRGSGPDYYALQILNTVLGGQFTSRINLNLRERHGFTYGARSAWSFRRGPGPFVASAGVFTAKTDSSLIELMKELKDVRGTRPLTQQEAEFARNVLLRGYPRRFESADAVANIIAELALYDLPETEISNYLTQIAKVGPKDVTRVANQYIVPGNLAIVVVGDLAKIRPGIEALHLGPVTVLNADGKPAAAQ